MSQKRSLTVLLVVCFLIISPRIRDARAIGPTQRTGEAPQRSRNLNNRAAALPPRVQLALKQAQLHSLSLGIRQLAQRVVTDLNDDVNQMNQLTDRISRQRTLQTRNLEAGFGMRRWSPDEFARHVEAAFDKANELISQYQTVMPWVSVTISDDGLTMTAASDRLECLVGRTEYCGIEITNRLRQPKKFEVSGEVAGEVISPTAGTIAPLSTAFAFGEFVAKNSRPLNMTLKCEVGQNAATGSWQVVPRPSQQLTVNIVNRATGEPCAARVFIRGSDGRYWIAGQRPVILAGEKKIMKFGYGDSTVTALLPEGEVQLKLQKGFEYSVSERTELLDVDKTVTLKLDRWVDMPAEGWYSGDTHVHWVRHTWYENGDPQWLNVHSRAEDLWVNNNLILKHWWKNIKSDDFPLGLVANRPDRFPVGKVEPLSVNGRIVWTGEEYRNDEVFGHMCFLRIDRLIEPVSTGFMGGPDAVHYPPNSHTYDQVHEAGGIVIAAHDVVKEVPIQAILGKLDVLDAHYTNRYYDLLNCGFKIPLSIGSDYPANLMGFARVYVYCGDKLDYGTWVDNLAAGKTFVSSGAMISLNADGKSIGDTIEMSPGETREILVEGVACANNELERVEIVNNGTVIRSIRATGEARKIPFREKVSIHGPGWIAARVFPASSRTWWGQADVAHTSPIYVHAGKERLVQPKAVRSLIQVLQGGRNAAQSSRMYNSEQQKQAILDYYDEGIRMFEELGASTG